jgi:hypothetical protein
LRIDSNWDAGILRDRDAANELPTRLQLPWLETWRAKRGGRKIHGCASPVLA